MKKTLYLVVYVFVIITKLTAQTEQDKAFDMIVSRTLSQNGLFNIYLDTLTGIHYLEIRKEQLDKPFLFCSRIINAPPETELYRGIYINDGLIITMHKVKRTIEFRFENNNFFANPASKLYRARNANVTPEILCRESIDAESNQRNSYLIMMDSLFLSEKLVNWRLYNDPEFPVPAESRLLGEFQYEKSKLNQVKSFHNNTTIKAALCFKNSQLGRHSDYVTRDLSFLFDTYRTIAIEVSYTLVSLDGQQMEIRKNDPRIGYLMVQQKDLISNQPKPWHDFICRWRLEKKHPDSAISEPVKPIIFTLDNATPLEWRPVLINAVESWNSAFEKAGYRHAVHCQMEPDDTEYDPDDLDINMIEWTTGGATGLIGYGPNIHNPYTGEIIGTDITLDYSVLNRGVVDDLIEQRPNGMLRMNHCEVTGAVSSDLYLAEVLSGDHLTEKELLKMKSQFIGYLVSHEVGHTLGLTHNFKGSSMLKLADLERADITASKGLSNSVMDYFTAVVSDTTAHQHDYIQYKPGLYDEWAIYYGYSTGFKDSIAEEKRLASIALSSEIPEHAFGMDSDASDESNAGFDPMIQRFDMSSEPQYFSYHRMQQLRRVSENLSRNGVQGESSTQKLYSQQNVLFANYLRNALIIAAQVGGVHFTRTQRKEDSLSPRFIPVTMEKQHEAISLLREMVFGPGAYNFLKKSYPMMLPERRGYENKYYETNDPKVTGKILGQQQKILDKLLNPVILDRIVNSGYYGNSYSLEEMLSDISDAIFLDDLEKPISHIRKNLQCEYITRLDKMLEKNSEYSSAVQSAAYQQMLGIMRQIRKASPANPEAESHQQLLISRIQSAISFRK
ncbi:MAG: zinc-dependent metalloprotease [Saprospiraceae bacterium]|nr:zinc-dependent metalloprotease [Saprospiraceae bacterium]HMW39736.1 zinc-dependent metalloprotease [Saprospiraceae bacterium]HMX89045.1 zinc-dependent metalloprotease [Saprospiraceae bacterium]HMZ40682.1 zinc-dependent metalloprotease [Saprospiraceae bacterium]HNA63943.1 zinc-dependent metalloprotease [Saprospiraceae bacterium]